MFERTRTHGGDLGKCAPTCGDYWQIRQDRLQTTLPARTLGMIGGDGDPTADSPTGTTGTTDSRPPAEIGIAGTAPIDDILCGACALGEVGRVLDRYVMTALN